MSDYCLAPGLPIPIAESDGLSAPFGRGYGRRSYLFSAVETVERGNEVLSGYAITACHLQSIGWKCRGRVRFTVGSALGIQYIAHYMPPPPISQCSLSYYTLATFACWVVRNKKC